jgi:hypothetical protein
MASSPSTFLEFMLSTPCDNVAHFRQEADEQDKNWKNFSFMKKKFYF